jgi:HEPN domain-containing protein
MKTKADLVNNWILKADKDLTSAEHELTFGDDAVTETICFHSQQAAEKFLKAYLVYLEISFTKTHEIGELITHCELKDNEIGALKEEVDILTDYAVTVRYPDDFYVPEIEEAKESYDLAIKVRNYILSKIEISDPDAKQENNEDNSMDIDDSTES